MQLRRPSAHDAPYSRCAAAVARIWAPLRASARVVHGGYTDLLYVLLPVWQAERLSERRPGAKQQAAAAAGHTGWRAVAPDG